MKKRAQQERFLKRLAQTSPLVVVVAVAGLILLAGLTVKLIAGGVFSGRSRYPQFVFEEKAVKGRVNKKVEGDLPPEKPLFDGEVYDKSLRLEEAMGLELLPLLYMTADSNEPLSPEQFLAKVPKDVRQLLTGLRDRSLLPPGVELTNDFRLSSARSNLIVRYRPEPFDVEVLSLPRTEGAGPALLLRLSDRDESDRPRYFESMQLEGVTLPEPFAQPSQIVAAGWMPKQIAGQVVSNSDVERARAELAHAGLTK